MYEDNEKKKKLLTLHNQILMELRKYTTKIDENTYQLNPLQEGKKYTFTSEYTKYNPRKAETITIQLEDEHVLITIHAEPTKILKIHDSFHIFINNDYDAQCDKITKILIENGCEEEEVSIIMSDGFCQVWYQRGYYISDRVMCQIVAVLPFDVKGIMCGNWWTRFSDVDAKIPGEASYTGFG